MVASGFQGHEAVRCQKRMRANHEVRQQPFRASSAGPAAPLRVRCENDGRALPHLLFQGKIHQDAGLTKKLLNKTPGCVRIGQQFTLNRGAYHEAALTARFGQGRVDTARGWLLRP